MTTSIVPPAVVEAAATSTRRLLDAKQVGARLGCSWRTVLRLADRGAMPPGVKLGRCAAGTLTNSTSGLAAAAVQSDRRGGRASDHHALTRGRPRRGRASPCRRPAAAPRPPGCAGAACPARLADPAARRGPIDHRPCPRPGADPWGDRPATGRRSHPCPGRVAVDPARWPVTLDPTRGARPRPPAVGDRRRWPRDHPDLQEPDRDAPEQRTLFDT
jgi:hypothetical protein